MNREFHTLPLIKPYEVQFRNSGIDITAFTTLLIAGIYYLNLHRRCLPFCEIDMNTEEGRNRIKEAAKSLLHILYLYKADFIHRQRELSTIADRMRKKGMSEEDIRECLIGE